MKTKWSKWVAVARWLDHGWNDPRLPWEKGVYRVRVRPAHSERGGEVVYIGRAGSHSGKETSTICPRVALFITACMGFWTMHSGGNRFFEQSAQGEKHPPVHQLSARDLEVSWAIDDDPICREYEELQALPGPPAFNKQSPRTCQRNDCARAAQLRPT